MTKDEIAKVFARFGVRGLDEPPPHRQFDSEDEIIAAIRPGVTFYTVIGRGGIEEYECLSPWQDDEGPLTVYAKLCKYIHVSRKSAIGAYKAKIFVSSLQNHRDKGVFLDRAEAEKFSAAADPWRPIRHDPGLAWEGGG